jgi:uncharacterized DUF497 family protein
VPPTVVDGPYEWDSRKDRANQRKHGVSFAEAATVLAHPQAAVFDDGSEAGRLKAVGMSRRGRVLTVVFEGRGERERIVSAWKATPEERRLALTGGGM